MHSNDRLAMIPLQIFGLKLLITFCNPIFFFSQSIKRFLFVVDFFLSVWKYDFSIIAQPTKKKQTKKSTHLFAFNINLFRKSAWHFDHSLSQTHLALLAHCIQNMPMQVLCVFFILYNWMYLSHAIKKKAKEKHQRIMADRREEKKSP